MNSFFLPQKLNTESKVTDIENKLVTRGYRWGGEGINQKIETDKLSCVKQTTIKNLSYSSGNSTQYSIMAYMRKEILKAWTYV